MSDPAFSSSIGDCGGIVRRFGSGGCGGDTEASWWYDGWAGVKGKAGMS